MDGWSGAVGAIASAFDKALEMGLIKMKERWTKEYHVKKKQLQDEYKKVKILRDYRLIKDLEDEIQLLMEDFENQIENGRS